MSGEREAFDHLGLGWEGVRHGQMFGSPALFIGKKSFGCFFQEQAVFKLDPATVEMALTLSGARLFDPGMGRPMKAWVQVPFTHLARWPELAKAAYDFVRSGA